MKQTKPFSARANAIALLHSVLQQKRTLDEAAAHFTGSDADTRFTLMLALTALRHLGQIDALLAAYVEKPILPRHVNVQHALRLGVAQLLLLGTPAHAAVNETVESVKGGRDAPLAGLVNAVMQRIAREKPPLPEAIHNIPLWLRTRWEQFYGADSIAAIADVAAMRPPLDLNMAPPFTQKEGVRMDDAIWRLPSEHASVTELEGFADGAFFVQDLAASYPARMPGDVKGLRVLDLGAAPGGKTAQLVRAGAKVTALERSPSRVKILNENMQRLKCDVEIVTADIFKWNPDISYDAILLDAPCSATGTWRKHPEVLQLVSETDIVELAAIQRRMLERAWDWLKPGGKLVYCVCSLEREEGEEQAAAFLKAHADAALLPITSPMGIPDACIAADGTLRTLPHMRGEQGGMDGFFAIALRKA